MFLTRGGFDVVIGNPPHGAEINNFEKELWKRFYALKERGVDSAKTFVERSIDMIHSGAPLSFVMPKPSTYSFSWEDFRNYVLQNLCITHCIDFGKAFENVKHEQVGIILFKKEQSKRYIGGYFNKSDGNVVETAVIPLSLFQNYQVLLANLKPIDVEIADWLYQKNHLTMSSFDIFRGLPRKLESDSGEFCYRGKDIGRYLLRSPEDCVNLSSVASNKINRLKRKKVIAQRIVAHVTKPFERVIIMTVPDEKGYLTFETVTNIVPDSDFSVKVLTALLNSRFTSWFVYKFIYDTAIRDMDFDGYFVRRIILPPKEKCKEREHLLNHLSEYLTFLYNNQTNGDIATFFDRQITDSLVYELYFKEKFHEDGIYPEPKEYLSELISKYLKPISYDRWAELHWKKQLEEKLTPEEEKELEELETGNTKTIESVHDAIAHDESIQKQIEKIKSHEWVKVIEGEEK